MAVIAKCKDISKAYGDTTILKSIDLELVQGEKVGIVGVNGAGKTTLANILTGRVEPTSGEVIWYKSGIEIGYMQQATDYMNLSSTLSGGEKTRKLLTDVLYSKCDLLLLDEPTNHLDYEGVKWLVKKVKAFRGTVIIISHDRYFLDQCVTRTVAIEDGVAIEYKGNYSWYRTEKLRQYESYKHRYSEQEKIKEQIKSQIAELRGWSSKAHRESAKKARETGNKLGGKEYNRVKAKKMDKAIKSRIKRLEKIEIGGLTKPKAEETISFQIKEAKKVGNIIVEASNIRKAYEGKVLFERSSFYIKRGERIGLYGVNGCGKSTLIKAILGEEAIEGEIRISKERRIGYISQDVLGLDETQTIQTLFLAVNNEETARVRTALARMGFGSKDLLKSLGCLSLGERMKLKLLKMILEGCEVLILDEPTNHIDLHVREQLEEALSAYNGTIILVTHDRYMLERLCDKLLVFKNKQIIRYEYGIREHLKKIYDKTNNTSNSQRKIKEEEERMLLENKIAYVIGALSKLERDTPSYEVLDREYHTLIGLRK